MTRRKTRKKGVRARRHKLKVDSKVTTIRFKHWQYVRWVRQATELAKQNLIEDELIKYLAEIGAPAAQLDYYLGYAKLAEKLAEKFAGYPLELLLQEITEEAEARGLNSDIIKYCLEKGVIAKGWVEKASYYDRNGLASLDFPEAGGAFCSFYNSVALVEPERTLSDKLPYLYRVYYKARIFAEDLNNLLKALLYAIFLTPALAMYYYPLMTIAAQLGLIEFEVKTGIEVPATLGRPWNVFAKTFKEGSLITAEDISDMCDIAELLRLLWAPDLAPFPRRFEAGDVLRSDIYNEMVTLLEKIYERIPKPEGGIIVEWVEIPKPAPAPVIIIPEKTYLFKELWSYSEPPTMSSFYVFEQWSYSNPPSMSVKFIEYWSG